MTDTDTPQPTIPPTPVLADAPPVEEPRRLKLAVGLLWTIAAGNFVGSGVCWHSYGDPWIGAIPLYMVVYHALVGIAYVAIAQGLRQRRPWAPATCVWLFRSTILLQIIWPLGAGLIAFHGKFDWMAVGLAYANLGVYAGPPMLVYVILGIIALKQLKRSGYRGE